MKTTVKFVLSTLVAAAAMNSTMLAADKIYVSSDYNSSTDGWGTTRFSNYAGAYAYATANDSGATIFIEKTNTLSGNTFDDNHKNYRKLGVVVEDGATLGNALSKWDMTYKVTVNAGGSLVMARPANAGVSNVHLKNALTIGERNSTQKAYLHFLSDSYQDGDISIRYNGSLTAYNADITVQDLDVQGTMTLEDCTVKVDGAFSTATSIFLKTTLTRVQMTVGGTQISGGLSDFDGGDSNRLGNFSMTDSTLTFGEGAAVTVAGNVTLTNSSISAGTIKVEKNKKITISGDCELAAIVSGSGTINVTEGATLTVASSSLLDGVKVEHGTGNIVYNTVDSEVTTTEITLKNTEGKAVELSSGVNIVVKSASEITDASKVEVIEAASGGVVLSAWSFDIENGSGDDKTEVTVTMDVGEGQNLSDIRIFHKGDGDWEDVTSVVTDVKLENGKLSFTTKDFSDYSAVLVPEPSMFGLMAGLGALVLVGTRRRRK